MTKTNSFFLSVSLLILLVFNIFVTSSILQEMSLPQISTQGTISYLETLNIDGDLALSEEEDIYYWNPHKIGGANAIWNATFTDECLIRVEDLANESGRVMTGASYDRSFKLPYPQKNIPIDREVLVEFDVMLEEVQFESNEWFRITLVNQFNRTHGLDTTWFLELDFWDSPSTYNGPLWGTVYRDFEKHVLHIDQIPIGKWKHYRFNLQSVLIDLFQDPLFSSRIEGFFQLLGSYIAIDFKGGKIKAKLHIKNLRLTRSSEPKLPIPYDDESFENYLKYFIKPRSIPIVKPLSTPPPLVNSLPRLSVSGRHLFAGDAPMSLLGGGDDYVFSEKVGEASGGIEGLKNRIDELKANYSNFNVVRLAFSMVVDVDSPFTPFDFGLMNELLSFLEKKEVYAILDAHHYFLPILYEDLWIQQWIEIAKYYKNYTVIAAFEISNEPRYDYGYWCEDRLFYEPFKTPWRSNKSAVAYMNLAGAIHKIDPDRIVTMTIDFIHSDLLETMFESQFNVLWTMHRWWFEGSLEEAQAVAENLATSLVSVQNLHNITMSIGEIGLWWPGNITVQDWWFKYWVETAKANVWGYCLWSLRETRYQSLGYLDYAFYNG